jgi:hypothetical protein
MARVARIVRVVGVAIGSLVAAYLAVWLIGGILFGWTGKDGQLVAILAIVLGGVVFADIMRREQGAGPPPA